MWNIIASIFARTAWAAAKNAWNCLVRSYERYRLIIAEERLRRQRLKELVAAQSAAQEAKITQAGNAVIEEGDSVQTVGDKLASLGAHDYGYGSDDDDDSGGAAVRVRSGAAPGDGAALPDAADKPQDRVSRRDDGGRILAGHGGVLLESRREKKEGRPD